VKIEKGFFVEIGSGDGLENNSRLLLETGWKGVWIDGSEDCCSLASKVNKKFLENGKLKIRNSLVTAENVNHLLTELKVPSNIDVLSLDVDLNTYHVWGKLEETSAQIAIIEYNGFFSLPIPTGLPNMMQAVGGMEASTWVPPLNPSRS
jgi:hypothetical protein